ncbi:hypothetical protein OUZ56_029071 [Daphnia magna]|uniref:Uncharacterized protein n=1 Tax=Daphnia magna TaxID=35525 RepID=A0ABR0B5R8_9CRUS|nr:hypothetical protein OUZ56_029071 [Daphnia magna]
MKTFNWSCFARHNNELNVKGQWITLQIVVFTSFTPVSDTYPTSCLLPSFPNQVDASFHFRH